MSHRFKFLVEVEVERESGKFAARDEMAEAIAAEIEGADPGSLDGLGADGETTYNVTDWSVGETEE